MVNHRLISFFPRFQPLQLQVEVRAAMNERDAENARTLADMDARFSSFNARLNHIMESVEGKIQNVSTHSTMYVCAV